MNILILDNTCFSISRDNLYTDIKDKVTIRDKFNLDNDLEDIKRFNYVFIHEDLDLDRNMPDKVSKYKINLYYFSGSNLPEIKLLVEEENIKVYEINDLLIPEIVLNIFKDEKTHEQKTSEPKDPPINVPQDKIDKIEKLFEILQEPEHKSILLKAKEKLKYAINFIKRTNTKVADNDNESIKYIAAKLFGKLDLFEVLKSIFEKEKIMINDLIKEVMYFKQSPQTFKHRKMHDYSDPIAQTFYFFIEFLESYFFQENLPESMKILIIENKFEKIQYDISIISYLFPQIEFYLVGFLENQEEKRIKEDKYIYEELYNRLKNKNEKIHLKKINFDEKLNLKVPSRESMYLTNFEYILLDLYLTKEDKQGHDFISLFLDEYPQIPVFVQSGIIDLDEKHTIIKSGVDYFIPKDYILLTIPFISKSILEKGKLLQFIKNDKNLYQNLLGNIRFWKFNPEMLWHGDKVYHMVNHGYEHCNNIWKYTNKILSDLFEHLYKKKQVSENNHYFLDTSIYILGMAVWLHDIGHKGNNKYNKPPQIRNKHGIISAELIEKYPKQYGFNLCNIHKTSEYNDIIKIIKLFCKYHKSNCPIDDSNMRKLLESKTKIIPNELYIEKNELLTFEKEIKNIISDADEVEFYLFLMSVFRFIDGLDINKNRVGNENMHIIKEKLLKEDIEYWENRLSELISNNKEDDEKYLEEIKEYIDFLKSSFDYYKIHNGLLNLEIDTNFNNNKIEIELKYITDKNKDYFKEECNGKKLIDYIIDPEQKNISDNKGYILKDWIVGKKYIEQYLILKSIKILNPDLKEEPQIIAEVIFEV